MSEQFAMQPDEFDATNNRLDSILDRLNALGESAASMKDAPLRPLQSVPPLDPLAPGVIEPSAPTPPPNLGLVPPAEPAPVVPEQPAVLEQPAAPVAPPQQVAPVEPVAPAPVAQAPAPAVPTVAIPAVEVSPPELTTLPDVPSLPDTFVPATPPEPATVFADPAPVPVEHYGLDLTPAPVEQAPPVADVESLEGAPVFELDAASLEAEAAIDPPEAPTSIFSLASSEPETVVPDADTEGDGWVSYHDDDPFAVAAPAAEVVEDVAQDVDPMWAIDPIEGTAVAEAPSAFAEETLDTTFFETPASDVPEPVEEPVEDFFAAFENSDEPVEIAGIDAPASAEEFGADIAIDETFTSDEDLPIPDFTGVYDETLVQAGLGTEVEGSTPQSVEPSMGQISARREELDKLRPVEGDEPVALEKESVDRSVMLQIVSVIFVGILAVLAVFLLDPAAVADMRESIEGLLP